MAIPADAWRTALLDSSLDCVIIMAADGVIVEINPGTEDTFGFSRASIIGQRLGDVFVPEELRERHEIGLSRYLATRESTILGHRVTVEAMHASGRRVPVELSIVHLAGTEPPLFVGHLQNITARVRSERRLRSSATANQILATSRSPETAIAGTLRAIGEELRWPVVQFWRVAGRGDRLELGGSWVATGNDPQPYQTKPAFRRGEGLPGTTLERGEAIWIEDIRSMPNACRGWVTFEACGIRSAVCFPVHVGGEITAVIEAFLTDFEATDLELLALLESLGGRLGHVITVHQARAALEASEVALRDALARAEEARRVAEGANAVKDEFLAVISHELRTPLGPIMGWARLLQRDDVTAADRLQAADAIFRNARLESQLVDDLLDASSISTGKLTIERLPVSLVHVIHAAIETVASAARSKGVAIRFDGDFDVRAVLGDAKRLQQVVSNLLTNALKSTPTGGHIEISVSGTIHEVTVTVRDTGEGIDPTVIAHIFDRFQQAPQHAARSGGLGLGLAIVRDLVAGHDGSVQAFSDGLGTGATFTVRLPTVPDSPASRLSTPIR
ncbi:MAG: PAS domain S-box protein [Acidobacteria bacterium]|nr:PAS domain S-box protein [Acidobacteriota bacterium]